jgi:hypothetical protein
MVSLGLHEGRLGYKRSLQFSKETNQHFKTVKKFSFLWLIFALPNPDPAKQNKCGSGFTTLLTCGYPFFQIISADLPG